MIYKVSVNRETLTWEEPDVHDPDISIYMEDYKWTAVCFEWGLSASAHNEAAALAELKGKIAETQKIDRDTIEFQVTHK